MDAAHSLPERSLPEREPEPELDLWGPGSTPVPEVAADQPADATGPAGTAPTSVGANLAERELRILEFEKHWWRYAGAKERAVRDEFGMSATRYYQVLNALIDSPEALVAEPMLVRRLRRLRSQRRSARAIRPPRPDVAEE